MKHTKILFDKLARYSPSIIHQIHLYRIDQDLEIQTY